MKSRKTAKDTEKYLVYDKKEFKVICTNLVNKGCSKITFEVGVCSAKLFWHNFWEIDCQNINIGKLMAIKLWKMS